MNAQRVAPETCAGASAPDGHVRLDARRDHANVLVVNPSSPLAFCIVDFRAVMIDTGAAALLLAGRGAAALPLIVVYMVPNGAASFFLFEALLAGAGRSRCRCSRRCGSG